MCVGGKWKEPKAVKEEPRESRAPPRYAAYRGVPIMMKLDIKEI